MSVQLPKGSDLRAQIDRLKGQPGNEYLGQLAERSDIDWQEVEVINKTWNYKKETMGPATAIIVAIGVSLLTGGVGGMASSFGGTVSGGLGLTGTVAGEIVAASASAGFSSLASMTATAVINNGGDLGAALEKLGSSANVKSLLVSMVTAGAIQGISGNIQVELLDDTGTKLVNKTLSEATLKNATFAQLLGKNMVSAIASATISSAVNGGSLEDSLKASLISAFLDTAAANGAYQIGNLTNDGKLSQTLAENFANKLMHGALGCAIGAAKANSEAGCASGAIGGVVGHLTADAVKDLGFKDSEVLALGQITSVLAATLAQKDLNIANSTAQNAIANNRLLHSKEKSIIKDELAKKMAKDKGISLEQAIEKLEKQLLREVDATAAKDRGWDAEAAQYIATYRSQHQGETVALDQWGNSVPLFGASGYQKQDSTIFSSNPQTTNKPQNLGYKQVVDYYNGAVYGAFKSLSDTVEMALSPIDTLKGMFDAVSNPGKTAESLQNGTREIVNSSQNGDMGPAGEWMGEQFGSEIVGAGIDAGASKVMALVKQSQAAKAAAKASKLEAIRDNNFTSDMEGFGSSA